MPAVLLPNLSASLIPASLELPLAAVAGVVLDRLLGEVRRWHPLVGFGKMADTIEQRLNAKDASRRTGVGAWMLAVVPLTLFVWLVRSMVAMPWIVDAVLLYFALGGRSLIEHVERVGADLAEGNIAAAREHVGWIVSRNTAELDEGGVSKACVESALENGNDAIFGTLFWFALLGGPGVVLFRLANTLDAMWGYKTPRFLHFGWAAARIDDVLNFIPARLTALTYALLSGSLAGTRRALACWARQATTWESPNAGPVMSTGAGSLGLALGGAAIYHGELEERPQLGEGRPARGDDIPRVVALLRRSIVLWLVVFLGVGVIGVVCA